MKREKYVVGADKLTTSQTIDKLIFPALKPELPNGTTVNLQKPEGDLEEQESSDESAHNGNGISMRPPDWKEIVKHYELHGPRPTLTLFRSDLNYFESDKAALGAIKIWKQELHFGKLDASFSGRAPVYGNDIDQRLFEKVKERVDSGQLVDNDLLRSLLVDELRADNRLDLLTEYGGKYAFQSSWAHRFWVRHNRPPKLVKRRASSAEYERQKRARLENGVGLYTTDAYNRAKKVDTTGVLRAAKEIHSYNSLKQQSSTTSENNSNDTENIESTNIESLPTNNPNPTEIIDSNPTVTLKVMIDTINVELGTNITDPPEILEFASKKLCRGELVEEYNNIKGLRNKAAFILSLL